MTAPVQPVIRPATLLYAGSALLLVYVASGTVLDDAIVALTDPSQEQLGWLFTILGIVSKLSMTLGTAILAAAIVLQGIHGRRASDGRGSKWSIQLPRKRPMYLSDAIVSDVEAFAHANGLATEDALNRLVESGVRASAV